MAPKKSRPRHRRMVLRLSDLDHSKSAVLNSLTPRASRRTYEYAIEEFITWYCSEPRLAFNRIVVTRYRRQLEARGLAATTINQRLAAVRRLANEASDCGLLSADLAAGIQRVKGAKQLGHRSGNWLSLEQSSCLVNCGDRLQQRRDCAMLATCHSKRYRSVRGIG
jgi:site-specific recombinase XerD